MFGCTESKIVDMKLKDDSRLHPIVEYYVDGKRYKATNRTSITTRVSTKNQIKYNNGYELGEIVTIHYDPTNPKRWYMKNSREQKVGAIIFSSFGLVFLATGILIFVLNR